MLNNIQILRAFAALNVVLFHILGASVGMGLSPQSIQFLRGWGESGVDIFFVISGFVMAVVHAGKNISPIEFMKLRIQRIVPIYWLLTLLILITYAVMPQLVKSSVPSVGYVFASFFFLSGTLIDKPPLLYVGWTLEYEMLFYVVFALSLLIPRGLLRITFQFICMAIAIIFGSANIILVEFCFGVIAGELYLRKKLDAYAPYLVITGCVFLCLSIFLHSEWSRLIIWGVPSLLIVWGAAMSPQIESRFLGYLGAASYSIYLMQVFALSFFYKLVKIGNWQVANEFIALCGLLFAILAGCLLHQYIEKPIAKFLQSRRLNAN